MTRRRDEQGFVLITAMIVLAVFMTLTIAMVTIVDVQTNQSGHERSGEAAFEIADSALQAEAYQLQLAWPDTAARALPACNQSTAQVLGCEGTTLTHEMASTPGPDYAHATWSAQVFDDSSSVPARYSTSLLTGAAWDANNDQRMWVRATATANGQTRTVVEQVMRRTTTVSLPENLVTAESVFTANDGNKPILNATSASGVVGGVDVRCGTSASTPAQGQGNCLGWDDGKNQLIPASAAYTGGYTDPTGTSSTLTSAQILQFIQTAAEQGNLYDLNAPSYTTPSPASQTYAAQQGCPNDPTAGVIVVAGTGTCSYSGNSTWNTAANPGMLMFLTGSVSFTGGDTFYGVLYMANWGNAGGTPPACDLSASPLAAIGGSTQVVGAVFADGCGGVQVGASGAGGNKNPNIVFSLSGLGGAQVYQTATPVQGTFQVVPH